MAMARRLLAADDDAAIAGGEEVSVGARMSWRWECVGIGGRRCQCHLAVVLVSLEGNFGGILGGRGAMQVFDPTSALRAAKFLQKARSVLLFRIPIAEPERTAQAVIRHGEH